MNIKRFLTILIAFGLILGTVSVNAAPQTSQIANEPWVLAHVDWYEDAHVGAYASIAHHPRSGKAYISYYDEVNTALKMAHEVPAGTGNCGPGNTWYCEMVDSTDNRGQFSSIAVTFVSLDPPVLSHTKIGISYYEATKKRLRYAQCILHINDAVCEWTFNNVDDASIENVHIGRYSSLAFDSDAVPHIAYNSSNDYDPPTPDLSALKYASYHGSGTGNCIPDGSWDCEFVDLGYYSLEFGAQCSLDFSMLGWPVISYYEAEIGALGLAFGSPGEGPACENEDWSCYIVDNTSDVGRFSTVHAQKNINDSHMIAYYDSNQKEIRFAEFVGPGGNCTSPQFDCYTVDQTADLYPENFDPISMDVDAQGYPIIAYMNSATETAPDYIEVARPAIAYGLTGGNCGDIRDGDPFQYWDCRVVDKPNSNINKGAFLSIDVAPSGLAAIAYSEQDLQGNGLYLKVAHQRYGIYLPVLRK
ncbi:MAG TPA: hypothetical protein PKL82_02270 [Anaerolineaceae bacterium]|jgi:hypothetical protein|nr:hypothetical protein [Anaerolineaceae bacterium]NMD26856.1 hypothetical protein [Chloroflexota bacterium]HOA21295.1 hypothetical protein [Anaerolineaceae bacterium]HOG77233.1 hypothetical protein [Anaerolineaceae bacterium]